MNHKLIEMIEKHGLTTTGKNCILKYLDGGKLTRKEAMSGKCFDCMGYFVDGRQDCGVKDCTLFPYRPFKDKTSSKHGFKSHQNAVRAKKRT